MRDEATDSARSSMRAGASVLDRAIADESSLTSAASATEMSAATSPSRTNRRSASRSGR